MRVHANPSGCFTNGELGGQENNWGVEPLNPRKFSPWTVGQIYKPYDERLQHLNLPTLKYRRL